jgi:hypothetical protein
MDDVLEHVFLCFKILKFLEQNTIKKQQKITVYLLSFENFS